MRPRKRRSDEATKPTGEDERVPTVLRVGPYRFFFYSNEGTEPPHVHVEAAGKSSM
jgi:hypothetical protein